MTTPALCASVVKAVRLGALFLEQSAIAALLASHFAATTRFKSHARLSLCELECLSFYGTVALSPESGIRQEDVAVRTKGECMPRMELARRERRAI
jgi:hypothetical protein